VRDNSESDDERPACRLADVACPVIRRGLAGTLDWPKVDEKDPILVVSDDLVKIADEMGTSHLADGNT